MALAAGDRVYLSVNGGLRSDPPLFGRVDVTSGSAPDVVRVNWENGSNQTFNDATPQRLVEIAEDPEESALIGARMNGPTVAQSGVVVRSWIEDPDGAAVRTAMLLNADEMWVILPVSSLAQV